MKLDDHVVTAKLSCQLNSLVSSAGSASVEKPFDQPICNSRCSRRDEQQFPRKTVTCANPLRLPIMWQILQGTAFSLPK